MPRAGRLRPVLLALVALVLLPLPSASARVDRRPDLQRLFAQAGTVGTMVVQERGGRRERTTIVGAPRSARRYLPSSTFKIPNSLLAIERGVASGADEPYPGPHPDVIVDGAPLLPAQCEGDLTLATAFRFSCTTTPRVGWVQAGERTWMFALNLDVTRPEHLAARTTIGRAILRELGAPLTG